MLKSRQSGESTEGTTSETLADSNCPSTAEKGEHAFGGFLIRRYRWGLSFKGKLLFLLALLVVGMTTVLGLYPFLALTNRVDANVLIVEGWVHPYAIEASAEEFRSGHYRQIFTTGGPVVGRGGYINDYQTSASVGAELLKNTGIRAELVQMVPSHVLGRDRTYSSAIALRDWFHEHDFHAQSLNIVTEGAHARRSRLLFQKALGPDIRVGVISVANPDFDATHWWYYSEGVEEIIQEGIGYLYAKFFLHTRSSR